MEFHLKNMLGSLVEDDDPKPVPQAQPTPAPAVTVKTITDLSPAPYTPATAETADPNDDTYKRLLAKTDFNTSPVFAIINKYLASIAVSNLDDAQNGEAEKVDYTQQAASGQVRGKKPVYINFAVGSDQILPSSIPALNDLKDSLAINSALALQLDGYTDNSGSDAVNIPLSASRAQAVKRYFQKVAPLSFPESRFASVGGHGSQSPIASNSTAAGKAANRRVEISQIGQ